MKMIEKGSLPPHVDIVLFTGENCEEISQLETRPHSGDDIRWRSNTKEGGWVRGYEGGDLPDAMPLHDDVFFDALWREFKPGQYIMKDGDVISVMSCKCVERDYEPDPIATLTAQVAELRKALEQATEGANG